MAQANRIFKIIHKFRKTVAVLSLLVIGTFVFLSYTEVEIDDLHSTHLHVDTSLENAKYLINTTKCRIPDIDPLNEDVLTFFKEEKYEMCSNRPPLTYVQKSGDGVKLKVNETVIYLYSSWNISCCYSKILRSNNDDNVFHSKCKTFVKETDITYPYIRVICKNIFHIVYKNVHTVFFPDRNKTSQSRSDSDAYKIFMIGIDSVSRLNLERTMPKTFNHLEKKFISFLGYNKIGDNTFPNLMAILSGRSMDTLGTICNKSENFDNCDIIWKTYKENGFLTAYGEDEPLVSTFNYYKKGFINAPTDFYLRPYMISAYRLPIKLRYSMATCTGSENTAERILAAAKDFATSSKDSPSFSLFWLNSFSHDNVNLPFSMDAKVLEFLTDTDLTESLNDSIIIIFSDHGFRFGNIRLTYTGWMEERLPFLYFKFPHMFKKTYSTFYKNFRFNAKERLVTPFDFHITLQNILQIFNSSFSIKPAVGCPKAQSLFQKIPENRSCQDACIPKHYCTCDGYYYISIKEPVAYFIGRFVVNQINAIILNYPDEADLCAKFRLRKIISIGKSKRTGDFVNEYLIIVETYPYAMFEATVQGNSQRGSLELLGDISRLNIYKSYTSCIIKNGSLKKYCFCDGWLTKIKSGLCYLFNC